MDVCVALMKLVGILSGHEIHCIYEGEMRERECQNKDYFIVLLAKSLRLPQLLFNVCTIFSA